MPLKSKENIVLLLKLTLNRSSDQEASPEANQPNKQLSLPPAY